MASRGYQHHCVTSGTDGSDSQYRQQVIETHKKSAQYKHLLKWSFCGSLLIYLLILSKVAFHMNGRVKLLPLPPTISMTPHSGEWLYLLSLGGPLVGLRACATNSTRLMVLYLALVSIVFIGPLLWTAFVYSRIIWTSVTTGHQYSYEIIEKECALIVILVGVWFHLIQLYIGARLWAIWNVYDRMAQQRREVNKKK